MPDTGEKFDRFVELVRELRSENGCPWDRKQSPLSLKRYILEEANELLEAIDAEDHQHVKEELGDLLYIIILLAQINEEKGFFAINDVIDAIQAKMIRRHPHVFSNLQVESMTELRENWLKIKANEKASALKPKKN